MRSRDWDSAGVCGRVLAMLEDSRFEAMLLVMLMKIGDEGVLIALRVVDLGLVAT